jgi:hypothetical protein
MPSFSIQSAICCVRASRPAGRPFTNIHQDRLPAGRGPCLRRSWLCEICRNLV